MFYDQYSCERYLIEKRIMMMIQIGALHGYRSDKLVYKSAANRINYASALWVKA